MHRTLHKTLLRTLTLALVAAPVFTIAFGVGAIGRGAEPAFAPLPTVHARTITIPLQTARPLSAAPGLRFTRFDADGCATLTHTVYRAEGGRQQTSEVFCRH